MGLLLRVREQMRTEMGLRDIDFRGCDGDGDCRIRGRFQICGLS